MGGDTDVYVPINRHVASCALWRRSPRSSGGRRRRLWRRPRRRLAIWRRPGGSQFFTLRRGPCCGAEQLAFWRRRIWAGSNPWQRSTQRLRRRFRVGSSSCVLGCFVLHCTRCAQHYLLMMKTCNSGTSACRFGQPTAFGQPSTPGSSGGGAFGASKATGFGQPSGFGQPATPGSGGGGFGTFGQPASPGAAGGTPFGQVTAMSPELCCSN
jgi:hypothetical protein